MSQHPLAGYMKVINSKTSNSNDPWIRRSNIKAHFRYYRKQFFELFEKLLKKYEEISDIPYAKLKEKQWKNVKDELMIATRDVNYKDIFPEYESFSDVIDAEIYRYNINLNNDVEMLRRSAHEIKGVKDEYNFIIEKLYMHKKTNNQLHGIWNTLNNKKERDEICNKKLWANLYYFFLTDPIFTDKTPVVHNHNQAKSLYKDSYGELISSTKEMPRGTFTKYLEWQWLKHYGYPHSEMDYIIEKIFSTIYKNNPRYKDIILPPSELAPNGSSVSFRKMIQVPWAGTGIIGNEILTPYEYYYKNNQTEYNLLLKRIDYGSKNKIFIWNAIIDEIKKQRLELPENLHNQPDLPPKENEAPMAFDQGEKPAPSPPPPIKPQKKIEKEFSELEDEYVKNYEKDLERRYKERLERWRIETAKEKLEKKTLRQQNSVMNRVLKGVSEGVSKGVKKVSNILSKKPKEPPVKVTATLGFQQPGGGNSKRKVSQVNKKDVLGKQRNVYKFVGDRKEYIKYKNEYVLLKKYKEMQKTKSKTKSKSKK
jgi:hypothetical protein